MLRRASRQPPFPQLIWLRHARKAHALGLRQCYVLLSFDCDTDKDIEVVGEVMARLRSAGVQATFAVPGEQLGRGASTYQKVLAQGGDFIAHGDHQHCALIDGEYVSSFFYDQLPAETVEEDIRRARQTVQDVLGCAPAGFRVPHFGSFQAPRQLAWLRHTLRRYGYRFSSSTMPAYAALNGPLRRFPGGFTEIPLSGCFTSPLSVLDSYGFRVVPTRGIPPERYVQELTGTVEFLTSRGLPGVLNTYVDPSQVYDFDPFWQAIDYVRRHQVPSLTFPQLLALTS